MRNLKKSISVFIIFIMVFSLVCPAFSVWAAENYSDYIPGEMPADLLPDGWVYGDTNSASVSFGWLNGYGTDTRYYAKTDVSYTATSTNWSVGGTLVKSDNVNGGSPLSPDTTYVFRAKFKNAGPEGTAPKFGIYYSGNKSRVFPNEYGSAGWTPESEFTDYNITFSTGENTSGTLLFGLVSAEVGDEVHMNYSNGMYLGVETAYDITNVITGENVVYAGESTTVKTEVVNQLYEKGNISQSVSYIILNADRTQTVDDITVTKGADGISDVNVSDDVPTGEYVILAVSDTYEGFRKGAVLNVIGADAFRDYIPGAKPANMVPSPEKLGTYTPTNSNNVSRTNTDTEVTWTEKTTVADNYWAVIPAMLSSGNNNLQDTLYAGKNYVFSVRLKNPTADTRPDMAFSVGSGTVKYFDIPVSNSEFETKSVVFTPTSDVTSLSMGFDAKIDRTDYTDLGSISLDYSNGGSLYIAEEVVYDIQVTPASSVSSSLSGGDTFTLRAKAVNQVGICGTLSQEFEWYALNADKTRIVSDVITITPSDNGKTAAVTLSDDISSGTYSIVAKSNNYEDLVRTYSISVGVFEEYIPGDKPENMVLQLDGINRFLQNNGAGGAFVQGDWKSGNYFRWHETAREANAYWRVGPTIITSNTESNPGLSSNFVKGKNYVVSVRLKNDTPDLGSIDFGVANSWEHVLTIPVDSTEYTTYTDTFTATQDTGVLCIGFDARYASDGGKILNMDISDGGSLYVAEEIAYDVLTQTDKTIVLNGETLSASACLVNQLGAEGKLSQNFNWQVLDANKTKYVGDYVLDISDDTANVSLTVGARFAKGTYYLAVNPSISEDMVKLIEFKVKNDGITYYVSPEGDDNADGTISSPFKTIDKAKEEVSRIKDKNSYKYINVVLRGGDYRLSDTLAFTSGDSGTDETPVTYMAYEGEKPVIKGSVVLDTSKIREALSGDIVPRLHPDAEGKVMVIDLAEQGLTDADIFDMSEYVATFYSLRGDYELNSLFADGVEQTLSMWPNDRNYSVRGDAIVDETYVDTDGKTVNVSTSFNYTETEPDRWKDASGWYIGAFLPYDYSYARLSVESLDTQNNIIKVHGNANNKKDFNFTDNFSKRWKAFNLIEEIDLPGEYAIDTANKLLYYYPTCDMENATLEIATMFDSLINLDGAENITFSGITFTQTNGIAISMKDVYNVDIRNCTFTGIGGTAVNVGGSDLAQTNKDYWQRQKIDASYNCDITDSVFTNLANSAIVMTGGNVDTLAKANNIIENNFIHDFSKKTLASSNGAIALGGCGITVRNNNISLSPGSAIYINGNDHIVEYNEIYDVMREVADAGAIYQGRNALARGTQIRYNYLHDMRPLDNLIHSGQVGIYLDDAQQGLTIENNIIKNVKIDFNSNGAGAYIFSGNTSIDIDKSWNLLNHSYTTTPTVTTGAGGTIEFIESQIYDKELYFSRYPDLEKFLDTDRVPGNNPKYFTVAKDNITVNALATNIQSENLAYSTLSNNQTASDENYSVFADAVNQDYRIKSDSQYALDTRLTEETFDIDLIGMQNTFALADEFAGFDTVYPAIGDIVANKDSGVTFLWNTAPGATSYTLTVAADAQFNNVVHTLDTRFTSAVVTTLNPGNTYYWKVEAKNTSREFARTWLCSNASSYFMLSDYISDVSLHNVTANTYDTLTLIKAEACNDKAAVTDFDIVIAAYSDGKLMASQRIPQTIPPGQSYTIDTGFDTEGKYTIEEIKIFVWGRETLIPYSRVRLLK